MDYLYKVLLDFKHFYYVNHFNLFVYLFHFIYSGLLYLLSAILNFVSLELWNLPNFQNVFFVIIFFLITIHLNFVYFISFSFEFYFIAILIQNFYLFIVFFVLKFRMTHKFHCRNFSLVKYFEAAKYYLEF